MTREQEIEAIRRNYEFLTLPLTRAFYVLRRAQLRALIERQADLRREMEEALADVHRRYQEVLCALADEMAAVDVEYDEALTKLAEEIYDSGGLAD